MNSNVKCCFDKLLRLREWLGLLLTDLDGGRKWELPKILLTSGCYIICIIGMKTEYGFPLNLLQLIIIIPNRFSISSPESYEYMLPRALILWCSAVIHWVTLPYNLDVLCCGCSAIFQCFLPL